MEIDQLVGEWLPLADAARVLDTPARRLQQQVREGRLVARRRGDPPVLCLPAAFLSGGELLDGIGGTLTVLRDAGFDDEQALRWLFTPDSSLPGRPVDALGRGRRAEVRRRAQAAAM